MNSAQAPLFSLNGKAMISPEARTHQPVPRPQHFTAAELQEMDLPAPCWAVEGMIAQGITLLAGPPKVGKSWLCLQLAIAVAEGSDVLGIPVEKGEVLYLALEDTPRR